jgi:hypothetical protein
MLARSLARRIATAVTLATVPLPLAAQTPPAAAAGGAAARPGEPIRVFRIENPMPLVGVFGQATPQGLMILVPGIDRGTQLQHVVPYDSIVRLMAPRGYRSRWNNARRGAAFGLLGGAILGAIQGQGRRKAATEGPRDSPPVSSFVLRWGAGGAALGAVIGYTRRSARWVDVPLPSH